MKKHTEARLEDARVQLPQWRTAGTGRRLVGPARGLAPPGGGDISPRRAVDGTQGAHE